jgi:hypothetical protein
MFGERMLTFGTLLRGRGAVPAGALDYRVDKFLPSPVKYQSWYILVSRAFAHFSYFTESPYFSLHSLFTIETHDDGDAFLNRYHTIEQAWVHTCRQGRYTSSRLF